MKKVSLLFMDVDGTLTDGKIYMGSAGEICKAFSSKDGCGIHDLLPQHDIIPVIITARKSEIVEKRCAELKITEVYQDCRDKRRKLTEVAAHYEIEENSAGILEGTAYIGDDILDLPCMKIVQYAGCPANAAKQVINAADFVSEHEGGNGAVRDFIEWLIMA